MLMRMIYDDRLAQAAYLIGCQRTGEAIIIDPERDVDRYIEAARREGLRLVAVAETHIHADFLSGARELAQAGAMAYISGEGGAEWQYGWLDKKFGGGSYRHQVLRNGDTFRIGNIEFKVMHTPGHTPEHICFAVTDRGGGATEPMGIITGDFVFVGDLGRPDLLESAAGQAGASLPAARRLLASVRRFVELPEYMQVWPAHGAGSACGKALGAVPQTTVGYEKRFNPSIRAAASEAEFISTITAGQPEPPMYFARMKRENRDGPALLGRLPQPRLLGVEEIKGLDGRAGAVIDTRLWRQFMAAHVAGALYAPVDGMFLSVVGSYVTPEEEITVVADPARAEEIVRMLVRIGLDKIVGWIAPATMDEFVSAGGGTESSKEIDVATARARSGSMFALDVRRAEEFAAGHIEGALHAAYPRLPDRLRDLPKDKSIIVNCQGGGRSARAVAYLQRLGYDATNLAGGYSAWEQP